MRSDTSSNHNIDTDYSEKNLKNNLFFRESILGDFLLTKANDLKER